MLYAAYGSNINLEQMAYRCPNSKVVTVGYINNWRLCFNVHADIRKTNKIYDDTVPVLLWDIADEDWEKLDKYEGFPKYYVKEIVTVYWYDDKRYHSEDAIVYVMADGYSKEYSFPKKDYFNIILEGYYENNIDFKYLHEAISYTSEMMESEYFDSCGWV